VVPMMNAEEVRSRQDLVLFLDEFAAAARVGQVPVENTDSVELLEAASRWVQDMDGFFLNRGEEVPTSPTWQLIAMVFAASSVYE
jgi:hypothetical protein